MLLYWTILSLVVSSVLSSVGAQECPDASWKLYRNLICVKVFGDPVPWAKAREACGKHGGDLVAITDGDMNQFVTDLLAKDLERYWVGVMADKDGTFKYIGDNQQAVSYTNWRKGQPSLSTRPGEKNCVEMIGNKRGRWKVKPCRRSRPYICQSDARPNKAPMSKWDNLKVTWGNPKARNAADFFNAMPRTVQDAEGQGFQKVSDCDLKAKWRGARYVLNNDYALVLLYDVNGYIAGIQTTVPPQDTGYPYRSIRPPFVKDGDKFILTAYFVDPKTICTKGRSSAEFASQGTGTRLYIQSGDVAELDSVSIPLEESQIGATEWTKGKCMPTMGQHYWYNTSEDMSCEHFYPVFLLYNKGELNAFGWAMAADLTSKRLEHPPKQAFPMFFDPVPKCLHDYKALSTMHIYLTSNIFANKC